MSRVAEARAALLAAQKEMAARRLELSVAIHRAVCIDGRSQSSVAREIGVTPQAVHRTLRRISSAPRA